MIKIAVFGIGKSSTYLIKSLKGLNKSISITLIDKNANALIKYSNYNTICLDILNTNKVNKILNNNNLVISLLPPSKHIQLANLCIKNSTNLITASYVSPKMFALNKEAKNKNVFLLNEMGVDPGLDHITACDLIEKIKAQGGKITSFSSHTGGLIAQPKKNSWNYKFTWNPKNVITAGAEGASILKEKRVKKIAYQKLFSQTQSVEIGSLKYDSYANRNSLNYIEKYNLENTENLYRGTLRHYGYCQAWNELVIHGFTNDKDFIQLNENATRKDFFFSKMNNEAYKKLPSFFIEKINEIQLLSDIPLKITEGTAADILLSILEDEWKLAPNDKDLLVMQHEIYYEIENKKFKATRSFEVIGENQLQTAMAKTVGIPIFEAVKLFIENKLPITGVHIPTNPIIYQPILESLENHGIHLKDEIQEL